MDDKGRFIVNVLRKKSKIYRVKLNFFRKKKLKTAYTVWRASKMPIELS